MPSETELTVWEKRLLKVLKDIAPKEYRKLLRQAGNLLRKNVRNTTPKVEGELRRSYRVRVKPKEDSVLVYTNKFYARMVEEGHAIVKYDRVHKGRRVQRIKRVLGFVPGKFYFRKGFEQTEKELPGLLKDFMRNLAREMGLDVSG
ncbi:MAG: HK97 gp10 family phage protein [Desulfotomaculales bacterium]